MNIRRYDPSQPRDWRGRWVTKSSRGAILYKKNPKRGVGIRGLKRNTVPYARFSTSGTTVGFNSGTILPGRNKRIVAGSYLRVEHVDLYGRQHIATNTLLAKPKARKVIKLFGLEKRVKAATKVARAKAPKKVVDALGGTKVDIGGAQARITSSRKYNPTITVRRGPHKVGFKKSNKGIREFNSQITTLERNRAVKVKKRPSRRKKNRKR